MPWTPPGDRNPLPSTHSCRRHLSPSPSGSPAARPARSPSTPTCVSFDFRTPSCRTWALEGSRVEWACRRPMSELKRLLDVDQGNQPDPLLEKLKAVAARGRAGAVVTKLQIAPDMSNVTVESTLWIRGGDRWFPFGSRAATVRPEELGAEAGKGLETDPQIQGAFKVVESLGLGAIPAELKTRSLRIGAATEKALGMARSAFNEDLQTLALPVLDLAKDAAAPRGGDQGKPEYTARPG